jgi:hypothetical protein
MLGVNPVDSFSLERYADVAAPWHFIPTKEAISEATFSTSYVS